MWRFIYASLFILLGGCSVIQTKVTVFHELEQPLSGITYAVVPYKEQEGSLEFQSYAKAVKAELDRLGMVETTFEKAHYTVFFSYGVDDGRQVVSSYPIYGQTGTRSAYTTGTVNSYGKTATYSGTTYTTPTYGVVGSGVSSSTVFTRYLNVEILDNAKSSSGKIHKVYEGKATSTGSNAQLITVMPAIIRSVFEEFPGKSGAVRTSTQTLER